MRTIAFRAAIFAALAIAGFAQTPLDDKRLVFSTFHGGDRFDDARSVAVDSNGFIYLTGETDSYDLKADPVGGKPLTSAVFKGYLTKYTPDGKEIVWRKLIGGSSNTVPNAVAIDHENNIFVAGTTGARDLPMKDPVQATQPGLNIAFLMKFNGDGELQFSTFFGGERNEEGKALAIDSQNNVYLAGRATSTTFPVKNAIQPKFGGSEDGFIAKFNAADLRLAYATYLGGAGADQIHAIAIGPDDKLYVTGETMSPGLATPDAFITVMPSWSSFVARINAEGTAVEYFTYVGWRSGYSTLKTIAVDGSGRAWVGGYTTVKNMPASENAFQRDYAGGQRDGLLVRLSADGHTADYLSYLGGSANGPSDPDEFIGALKIDVRGYLHVAGQTNSLDFPGIQRAPQREKAGGFDSFLLHLDPETKTVFYSTFWGGAKNDDVVAIALGPGEAVTIAGATLSADLPVNDTAAQKTIGSADDGFVMQFCDPWPGSWSASGWNNEFAYTQGSVELPAAQELVIYTGCQQKFSIENGKPEVSAEWLRVTTDGTGTVSSTIKLEANVEGLEPGEYKAVIRIRVPDAYQPLLEIPVTLRIAPTAE